MKLSVKTKLIAGFTIMLLILAVMGYFLTRKLSESNERLTQIVNVSAKKVSLSQEIVSAVMDAGRQEKNMILDDDPTRIRQYDTWLRNAHNTVAQKTKELEVLVDEEGAKILSRFSNLWASYQNNLKNITELAFQNRDDEAFLISSGVGYTVREEAQDILNELVSKNQAGMDADKLRNDESHESSIDLILGLLAGGLIISLAVALWIIQGIGQRITDISAVAARIASREYTDEHFADQAKDELSPVISSLETINQSFREITDRANVVASGDYSEDYIPTSGNDRLGIALRQMTVSLRKTSEDNRRHNWLTSGQNRLNDQLRGDQTIADLSQKTLDFLCQYVNAVVGALYIVDPDNLLHLTGKYALSDKETRQSFKFGEGLVGRAALDQQPHYLDGVEAEHIRAISAVMDTKPANICIVPIVFEGKTLGVIEMGHLTGFTDLDREFIQSSLENIAIAINSANARKRIQQLLEETQVQSEELQSQQEELRQVNEELEEQAQSLRQQQEELQMVNEELEEQTQMLEHRNKEVEQARLDIELKTKQLEVSSKYKSEFLANMSHELRTPLNSLLILSKDLADNSYGNLTAIQVESAEIIYNSGQELLALINEVLDLSKIEAGKMSVHPEPIRLELLANDLFREFKRQAEKKSLRFQVNIAPGLPGTITSDPQRLKQILKNLLSNAIKFTQAGQVIVDIKRLDDGNIAFAVTDTGIGIPEDKQMAIFEAFQQADGGTSRKYGGTGLGLSISRELAKLLQGKISISSKVGEGSEFTLILPPAFSADMPVDTGATVWYDQPVSRSSKRSESPAIEDDRQQIGKDDRVVLIVEDDDKFALVLRNQARDKGFKTLVASSGEVGLSLAEKYKPSAIMLDLDLPGINGHQVLAELKSNIALRHIPVHIISVDERTLDPIKNGAVEFLTKPVNKRQVEEAFARIENFIARKMKNLLIIEDDENSRTAIRKLIGNGDVHTIEAGTGTEAVQLFEKNHIDCMVMDLGLPDISGFELIQKLQGLNKTIPPIIIYTGRELTKSENDELQKYAETIIIKGTKSEERLLDETALFLHRTIGNLPESKQKMISSLYDRENIFQSRKVLLVDDDMRNVFALSKILREKGMNVNKAENGVSCLQELEKDPDVDIILMDIMMPIMDGYEAMRQIRNHERFRKLPIIALTAKAMKEDKQKCIDAGANDYITKPVDVERLLSLMRVWLSK